MQRNILSTPLTCSLPILVCIVERSLSEAYPELTIHLRFSCEGLRSPGQICDPGAHHFKSDGSRQRCSEIRQRWYRHPWRARGEWKTKKVRSLPISCIPMCEHFISSFFAGLLHHPGVRIHYIPAETEVCWPSSCVFQPSTLDLSTGRRWSRYLNRLLLHGRGVIYWALSTYGRMYLKIERKRYHFDPDSMTLVQTESWTRRHDTSPQFLWVRTRALHDGQDQLYSSGGLELTQGADGRAMHVAKQDRPNVRNVWCHWESVESSMLHGVFWWFKV